jgi:hypothetical protein
VAWRVLATPPSSAQVRLLAVPSLRSPNAGCARFSSPRDARRLPQTSFDLPHSSGSAAAPSPMYRALNCCEMTS